MHYEALVVNILKKSIEAFERFVQTCLNLKIDYEIVIRAMLQKKLVLEIAGKHSNQTYMASAQKFQTHFGVSFS